MSLPAAFSIDRLGAVCAALALRAHRHPRSAIAVALLVTALLAGGLATIRIDTTMEGLLTPGDSVRVAYDEFRAQFGADERILVLVRAEPALFELSFLTKLAALHRDLERELPYLEKIESLVNARVTSERDGSLRTHGFLDPWPATASRVAALAREAARQPLYESFYFSPDHAFAAVVLEVSAAAQAPVPVDVLAGFEGAAASVGGATAFRLLDSDQNERLNAALGAIVARHRAAGLEIGVTGGPVLQHSLIGLLGVEMARFTALGFLCMAILLWFALRRLSGVLMSIAVVALSLGGVIGAMGWIGLPLTPVSQIFPSLLLAVGVSGSVHLLSQFYQRVDAGEAREQALANAFQHSGPAVVFTSATTALSLFAFTSAEVAPVRAFGLAAPIGVVLAMLFSFVLLPAGAALWPTSARRTAGSAAMTSGLHWLARGAVRHPHAVLAGWLALGVISVLSALEVRPELAPLRWLPEGHPTRVATELADQSLGASTHLQMLLSLPEGPGAWLEPERLAQLGALQQRLATLEVGGTRSGASLALPDIVREVNRALHSGDDAASEASPAVLPATRAAVAQQLLLFEMSAADVLAEVSDPLYGTARVQVLMTFGDGFAQNRLARRIEGAARELIPGARVQTTGVPVLSARTWAAMIDGAARSLGLSLVAIGVLMCLLTRGLLSGAAAMIPNLLPIAVGLAFMRWTGISFDLFTSLVGTIAIGIAVDDTIHMLEGYRHARSRGAQPEPAVTSAVVTSGRALVITSTALVLGFCIFTIAQMSNVAAFGVVSATVISLALAADLSLMPALLVLLDPVPSAVRERGRERPASDAASSDAAAQAQARFAHAVAQTSSGAAPGAAPVPIGMAIPVGLALPMRVTRLEQCIRRP